MKQDVKFITCCPDDTYYTWQVHLWLESLKEIGKSGDAVVLIFIPNFRNKNTKWQQIIDLYPEAQFIFYKDDKNELTSLLSLYIPVLRPWCMAKYFQENPEDKVLFYCDSDILFTEKFDIQQFIDDDVCYLSDTNSYINASYFDSKTKDVLSNKIQEYIKRDVLGELCSTIGITREICEKNNLHSGGAQYLLKGTNEQFWRDVLKDCIIIRKYLMLINKQFFQNESKGFQSWCADMWAVLWNLWKRDIETKVVPELDFAWSTDRISVLENKTILHNAGIVGDLANGYPAFYKGKYHTGSDPFKDEHLYKVYNDEKSKGYCTWQYVKKLIELKEKYNLNY